MVVRVALPEDVPGIARVHVSSWEGVYRGLVPDAMLERLTVQARTQQWMRFFEESRDRSAVLVAEQDDTVVGMVVIAATRDDDLDSDTVGEVEAIYVEPVYWDRGHGRDLMLAAFDLMRSFGFIEAMLWVLDTNVRGRSFYARGGWTADGATKVDDSFGEPLSEVRYRLNLRSRPG